MSMYLKRLYNEEDGSIRGVRVLRLAKTWHLSPRQIQKYVDEGWMVQGKGVIQIDAENGQVVFDVVASPNLNDPEKRKVEEPRAYYILKLREPAEESADAPA